MNIDILIIDDEDMFREDLAELLRQNGFSVRTADNGKSALEISEKYPLDIVLCDLVMPGIDGIEVLEQMNKKYPSAGVMLMTAFADVETCVRALRCGAIDYILKPVITEDIIQKINRFIEYRKLQFEIRELRKTISTPHDISDIIGESRSINNIKEIIVKISSSSSTVLITGETGTGKELVARAIHEAGGNSTGAFVPVNISAIPRTLVAAELFGYKKGAFTGAQYNKKGLIQASAGGTLFLDEVSEIPLDVQVQLLRAIDRKEILPLGSSEPVHVETRIISTTNRDLQKEINKGTFRADIFYRLRVMEIHVPALRERKEDIPLLIDHFIHYYNPLLKKHIIGMEHDALRICMAYPWHGNIRELENVIERTMILTEGEFIGIGDLPVDITGEVQFPEISGNLKETVKNFEREHIQLVLKAVNNNRNRAAKQLGINISSLYRKLKELRIEN